MSTNDTALHKMSRAGRAGIASIDGEREPMRRATEAIATGETIPPEDWQRLSAAERDEAEQIARLVKVTQAVLATPEPNPQAEARSLQQGKGAARTVHPASGNSQSLLSRLRRWWNRVRQ